VSCDECVTGTLLALSNFVGSLTGQALAEAQPILYAFIADALGTNVGSIQSIPLNQFFGPPGPGVRLNQGQQIAVLSALLNLPAVAKFLEENPGAVSEFGNDAVVALGEQTIQLVLNIYNSVNPRLQFCGEVEPKIFGFSLTGGNTLVAARAFADKTNLRADATFSPSYVFGNMPFFLLSGGTVNNVVPALDEATMGFAMGLPLVNETTVRLLTTNPVEFASTQVNHLLANATLTFGYEDDSARRLGQHQRFLQPDERGQPHRVVASQCERSRGHVHAAHLGAQLELGLGAEGAADEQRGLHGGGHPDVQPHDRIRAELTRPLQDDERRALVANRHDARRQWVHVHELD